MTQQYIENIVDYFEYNVNPYSHEQNGNLFSF